MKTDNYGSNVSLRGLAGWKKACALSVLISTLSFAYDAQAQEQLDAPVKYDVIDIKPLAGSNTTQGIGIADVPIVAFNSLGSVMGVSFVKAAACEFDPTKPANGCNSTDFGVIGIGGLGSAATVNAISRDGTFEVGILQKQDGQPTNQAFCVDTPLVKRKKCTGLTNLPNLKGGAFSNALGIIYDDKWITGTANDNNGTQYPVIWEQATLGIVDLQRLNKADNFGASFATGGTLVGFIVGSADQRTKDGLLRRAVRWTAAGQPAEFDAPAGMESSARAANLFFEVVGTTGSQPNSKGAFWKCGAAQVANCKWNRVDFSSGVTTEDSAHMAINDSRIAVGQVQNAKGRRATMWDLTAKNIVDVDLNDLIDPKLGWVLTEANGINNSGIIVGTGTLNGNPRGYILIPKK